MSAPVNAMATIVPDVDLRLAGVRAPEEVMLRLATITVVTEPDAIDHATIVLANPFPELPFTDGDFAGTFAEGTPLTLSLGYVDALDSVFDGEITSLSPAFPRDESPTFVVEAYNRLHRLTAPPRSLTYQDVTDSDIASDIAQRNGLAADVTATSVKHEVAAQVNRDDFAFLRSLAAVNHYEVRVDGTTLGFHPAALDAAPVATLSWADQQLGAPLVELSLRLNARRPAPGVRVRSRDPLTGDPIEGVAAAGDEETTADGDAAAQVAAAAFGADRELLVVDHPVLSAQEATALARALFNELGQSLIEAEGTVPGMTALRTGTVVQLAGVGRRFSGHYYVTRTLHRLSPDGYLTSFSARRGAVGSA
jgi:uncharacterized protein